VYDAEKEASQHGLYDGFQVCDFNRSRCSQISIVLAKTFLAAAILLQTSPHMIGRRNDSAGPALARAFGHVRHRVRARYARGWGVFRHNGADA
jgi:hypothetical protein